LCFGEDVVERNEEGLGEKLISVRLIGGPHEWWFEELVHLLEER
jgi:hypothetical protein